ncbi:MAG: FAD synthase [Thermoproteota archaeon]|nr:MAG: FAD synthase [Candidatus Korarchaeota archaeon]
MRKKVVAAGTFDLIHPGHVMFLREAKRLAGPGGELVVIVARDETVKKFKGREPVLSEEERLRIVSSLKPVDRAILGDLEDLLSPIIRERPDVLVLGYDQWPDEERLREELTRRGLECEVVRLPKFECLHPSSTSIIERIVKIFCGRE